MKFKPLSIACLVCILSACQSIEKKFTADVAIKSLNLQETTWQAQAKKLQFANDNWLKNLNDPRLEKYVRIALKNNFDLQANESQLAAQIQNARQVSSQLFPRVDFLLRRNSIESQEVSEANNSPALNTTPISDTTTSFDGVTYDANFNISWEIDIWRRLSAQSKASAKTTQATAADYEAARLSLVAAVARAWFNLNNLKLQVDIAEKRLAAIKESLEIVEEQYLNGSQSALNVYLDRTDYASQQANILELKGSLDVAIRDFKVLLGEYPNIDINFDANLPEITQPVPAGLPAELVMRRPDVLADLYDWQSSAYDTAAAKRARYPTFSLTASYGSTSNSLSGLDEASLLLNLLNNLSLPLFNAGQIKAQIKTSKFLQDANFKIYLSTLLNSFNEVESTLAAEKSLKARLSLLTEAASLSESGYNLALDQYISGISSYDTVLDARQRWFNAQTDVVMLRNAVLQNRIDLNLALGGDFENTNASTKNKPIAVSHTEPVKNVAIKTYSADKEKSNTKADVSTNVNSGTNAEPISITSKKTTKQTRNN